MTNSGGAREILWKLPSIVVIIITITTILQLLSLKADIKRMRLHHVADDDQFI